MEYSIDQAPGRIVVAVEGDLDAAMVQEMRAAVEELHRDGRPVVFDLSRVEFIDSAGIGLIVRTYKARQAAKAPMAIAGAAGQPRQLLATTQIDRLIPFHASLAELEG